MEINAYATSDLVRYIVASVQYTDLATNSLLSIRDFRAVLWQRRTLIPDCIKDYVALNQFAE